MAAETGLNALAKDIQDDYVSQQTYSTMLINRIKQIPRMKIGNEYKTAVKLRCGYGTTFTAASSATTTIVAPTQTSPITVENASVAVPMMRELRRIPHGLLPATSGNKNATYADGFKLILEDAMTSIDLKREANMLYGTSGLSTVAAAASNKTIVTGTTTDVDLTLETGNVPVGLFKKQAFRLEIWESGATTVTYDNVDVLNFSKSSTGVYTLRVRMATAANATAIDINANALTLYFKGYSASVAAPGIYDIAGNTGTLYGIDSTNYDIWQGNVDDPDPATALTFDRLQDAAATLASNGSKNGDIWVYVSPSRYSDLLKIKNIGSRFVDGYDKAKYGGDDITVVAGGLRIRVIEHNLMKESHAYFLTGVDNPNIWGQIGAFQELGAYWAEDSAGSGRANPNEVGDTAGWVRRMQIHADTSSHYVLGCSRDVVVCKQPNLQLRMTNLTV